MAYRRLKALLLGFVLDAALGDPKGWPHIVRLIGKRIELEERAARSFALPWLEGSQLSWGLETRTAERLCGAAIVADVALLAPVVFAFALRRAEKARPSLTFALEVIMFYQLIAARALVDESMDVYDRLVAGDLEGARQAVSMIVGRDVEGLDASGVARAAVETIAENASDGVVAPLLHMAIGGVPAALAYKAVNTLDSMMGYKTERYINFGWAAARLDDVANFLPARVTGLLMCAAAKLIGMDAGRAWQTFRRDRMKHPSPNAGHAEAACAGALEVQLGGLASYSGQVVHKETLGEPIRPIEAYDIPRANRLMYATACLALGVSACLAAVDGWRHRMHDR